jgi:hypothetical protein
LTDKLKKGEGRRGSCNTIPTSLTGGDFTTSAAAPKGHGNNKGLIMMATTTTPNAVLLENGSSLNPKLRASSMDELRSTGGFALQIAKNDFFFTRKHFSFKHLIKQSVSHKFEEYTQTMMMSDDAMA